MGRDYTSLWAVGGFPGGSEVKNPPTLQETQEPILGSGKSPGGGHGIPPPYSYLENSMDRGAWHITAHGVAESWA